MGFTKFAAFMLFISGLVLLSRVLDRVPVFGESLSKFAKFLADFGVIIGIIDLIWVIPTLFS